MNPVPGLVSVILPVRNGARWLHEAVTSVLAQSYPNFELLIINDGSTDHSMRIAAGLGQQDDRIRLFSRDARGLVATLNEGIELARGEFIARMDADDRCLPGRFDQQLHLLQGGGVDICGGAVRCFGGRSDRWRYPLSPDACNARLLFENPLAHPAVTGRAECFRELGYRDAYSLAEDYDLWQRAVAAGWRLGNVPEEVLYHRVHTDQLSMRSAVDQRKACERVRIRHWAYRLPDAPTRDSAEATRVTTIDAEDPDDLLQGFEALLGGAEGETVDVLVAGMFGIWCRIASRHPRVIRHHAVCLRAARHIRRRPFDLPVLLLLVLLRASPGDDRYRAMQRIRAIFSGLCAR